MVYVSFGKAIDALLEHEWNQVQVSYEAQSTVTLSDWGVFVYKQGTNMEEYVQFMCPDPKYSQVFDISPTITIVPPKVHKLAQMKLIDELALDEMLAGVLSEARDMEDRFSNKHHLQDLLAIVSGINKEFQNSKEIHDLMTDTYSNGTRDGLLEARAILLTLDMDMITHVLEGNTHEISTQDKDSHLFSKNQYGDFIEKQKLKSSLNRTKIRADAGKEGCKEVKKHKKLAAVLKEKEEELLSLYDAEIEEFQNSEEIQDLMSATYLNGLRDGVLEAQATLLSLTKDRTTPMLEENEEHITHEDSNDVSVNDVSGSFYTLVFVSVSLSCIN